MNTKEILHADYIESLYRGESVRVDIANISHFKAEDKYVVAYHDGGELLLCTPTLELEQAYSERFIRVHRNALVARNRLVSFTNEQERTGERPTVRLDGVAEPLIVSRINVAAVRAAVAHNINQQQAGEAA